jgi:hypothetical protein
MMNRYLLSLSPAPESSPQSPKLLPYLSAFKLNLPKNTLRWLALVGFLRFNPPGSGSGPSGSQAFTCMVRTSSQLRSALFPLLSGLPFPDVLMDEVSFQYLPRFPFGIRFL